MLHFLPTLKLASGASLAIIGSGAVGYLASDVIGDNTGLTVGLVCALGGGVWYLSSTLQKLKDGQRDTKTRLSRIEKRLGIDADEPLE